MQDDSPKFPHSPDPSWRNNFAFTVSYPNVDKSYIPDRILVNTTLKPPFSIDPIIHKFPPVR